MRIAVVDDDAAVREGVAVVLERPGREVAKFEGGAAYLEAGGFDLTFLDLKMPSLSGFEVLRRLGARGRIPPVVMISAHGDVRAAVEAMRLGAHGFVEKPFTPRDLEDAITDVASSAEAGADRDAVLSGLTPREREVAVLLDEGLSNKDVAARLTCSPRTVEIHRSRVFEKLGVRNVAGLVRLLSGRAS